MAWYLTMQAQSDMQVVLASVLVCIFVCLESLNLMSAFVTQECFFQWAEPRSPTGRSWAWTCWQECMLAYMSTLSLRQVQSLILMSTSMCVNLLCLVWVSCKVGRLSFASSLYCHLQLVEIGFASGWTNSSKLRLDSVHLIHKWSRSEFLSGVKSKECCKVRCSVCPSCFNQKQFHFNQLQFFVTATFRYVSTVWQIFLWKSIKIWISLSFFHMMFPRHYGRMCTHATSDIVTHTTLHGDKYRLACGLQGDCSGNTLTPWSFSQCE